ADFKGKRQSLTQEARELVRQLGTLQDVLTAKRERPATPADMSKVTPEAEILATAGRLAESVEATNAAIATHNQAVADFTKHRAAAETSIRRHFIADCRDDFTRNARELADLTAELG